MGRPITQEERQVLMDNTELVMFMPRHRGLEPVVFLLVIPVTTMVVLAGALYLTGTLFTVVEAAPTLSCLAYVAISTLMPWVCLRIKTWYDEAYGCDRELRALLRKEGLTVEVVRITGYVPERAEVYAEGDDGPFMFGIASTYNTFTPQKGTRVALIHTGERGLAVRPDPKTGSLVRDAQGIAPWVYEGVSYQGEQEGELAQKHAYPTPPI